MLQYYPSRLLVRTVDPASEPVSLSDAKNYLRVDITDDDTLISDLITSARAYAEEYMRRSLITQTWKLAYDGCLLLGTGLPYISSLPITVPLPRGPLNAVSSVTAYMQDGSSSVISSGNYTLNAGMDALLFYSPVLAQRMEIIYTAGYGASGASVPSPIVRGIQAHIAAMYDRRGDASMPLPAQSEALYMPYRDVRI